MLLHVFLIYQCTYFAYQIMVIHQLSSYENILSYHLVVIFNFHKIGYFNRRCVFFHDLSVLKMSVQYAELFQFASL
jgi:hypothetical protein